MHPFYGSVTVELWVLLAQAILVVVQPCVMAKEPVRIRAIQAARGAGGAILPLRMTNQLAGSRIPSRPARHAGRRIAVRAPLARATGPREHSTRSRSVFVFAIGHAA